MADASGRQRAELEDVVAWLLLNSFKSERVQFELWCLHCAQNVWRKYAFEALHAQHGQLGVASKAAAVGALTDAVASMQAELNHAHNARMWGEQTFQRKENQSRRAKCAAT